MDNSPPSREPADGEPITVPTKRELLRLILAEREDPAPFYQRLAERTIALFPFQLSGQRVLDLGSGPGHFAAGLKRAGAHVVAVDWNGDHALAAEARGIMALRGDATRLPFPDGSFDGIFCSNLLEHVASSTGVMDEIERVLTPGGWAWVSWTNWYSPWGGHHITPFHYLGPDLGARLHDRLKGPPPKNRIYDGLWPTNIGDVAAETAQRDSLEIIDVVPRYYPSQRWITRVPILREVLTWNCLMILHRPLEPIERNDFADFGQRSVRTTTRRLLRRTRSLIGNDPVFLPVVLRATPRGTSRQITSTTDLVVEGYPRSGNTFVAAAIRHVAGPELRIASHVHTPSQVVLAVKRKIHTVVVIRRPFDSVVSLLVAAPHVPIDLALREWIDHYRRLWPLRDDFVIAIFDTTTTDLGSVIKAVNLRFDAEIPEFVHNEESLAATRQLMEADHQRYHSGEDRSAPWPTSSRDSARRFIESKLREPQHARLLAQATEWFELYREAST